MTSVVATVDLLQVGVACLAVGFTLGALSVLGISWMNAESKKYR